MLKLCEQNERLNMVENGYDTKNEYDQEYWDKRITENGDDGSLSIMADRDGRITWCVANGTLFGSNMLAMIAAELYELLKEKNRA